MRPRSLAAAHSTLTRSVKKVHMIDSDHQTNPNSCRRRPPSENPVLLRIHAWPCFQASPKVSTKAQAQPCGFVSGEPGRFGSACPALSPTSTKLPLSSSPRKSPQARAYTIRCARMGGLEQVIPSDLAERQAGVARGDLMRDACASRLPSLRGPGPLHCLGVAQCLCRGWHCSMKMGRPGWALGWATTSHIYADDQPWDQPSSGNQVTLDSGSAGDWLVRCAVEVKVCVVSSRLTRSRAAGVISTRQMR